MARDEPPTKKDVLVAGFTMHLYSANALSDGELFPRDGETFKNALARIRGDSITKAVRGDFFDDFEEDLSTEEIDRQFDNAIVGILISLYKERAIAEKTHN